MPQIDGETTDSPDKNTNPLPELDSTHTNLVCLRQERSKELRVVEERLSFLTTPWEMLKEMLQRSTLRRELLRGLLWAKMLVDWPIYLNEESDL